MKPRYRQTLLLLGASLLLLSLGFIFCYINTKPHTKPEALPIINSPLAAAVLGAGQSLAMLDAVLYLWSGLGTGLVGALLLVIRSWPKDSPKNST